MAAARTDQEKKNDRELDRAYGSIIKVRGSPAGAAMKAAPEKGLAERDWACGAVERIGSAGLVALDREPQDLSLINCKDFPQQ
jgi:hypothetical protein